MVRLKERSAFPPSTILRHSYQYNYVNRISKTATINLIVAIREAPKKDTQKSTPW